MDQATGQLVRRRAAGRCEYCGIDQPVNGVLPFHVEHVRALKHGGSDEPSNLALACHHCNLHKGRDLSGVDPLSDAVVELFHPRRQHWSKHFQIARGSVVGMTPTGRATIEVLAMNADSRVELRKASGAPEQSTTWPRRASLAATF